MFLVEFVLLVFCVVFWRSLFVFLAIVLSVLLRFTDSDYSFGICKLFLCPHLKQTGLYIISFYILDTNKLVHYYPFRHSHKYNIDINKTIIGVISSVRWNSNNTSGYLLDAIRSY